MREDSNWFLKWEEELPSPEDLMPLSQTLITPDLASVFDIRTPSSGGATTNSLFLHYGGQLQQQSSSTLQPPTTQHNSSELDSSSAELCGGVGGIGRAVSGADESARTLKRPRLVWTPQLHKRFVDAVAHLGIKNAVPKTIMQLMSVDGLTRENVASHLQKYRLYLKRMQGIHNGAGNGPGHGGGLVGSADSATDHLFASSPVPAHFLSPTATSAATGPGHSGGGARPNSDRFYMPVAAVNHQRMAAAVAGHQQSQGQYNNFGPGQGGGQFDHLFLSRQAQLGPIKNGVELGTANNGRKILTLFPTDADD